jgi:ATP-binding dynein motor region
VAACRAAEIPSSRHFVFSQALGDPVVIRQWNIWGLPKDDFSCSNGIILFASNRWPLCIDPQGQTNKWIRTMHADDQLCVVKMTGAAAGASALTTGITFRVECSSLVGSLHTCNCMARSACYAADKCGAKKAALTHTAPRP